MKKLIALLLLVSSVCFGQTFDVQNLVVHGTAGLGSAATITGGTISGLSSPLPVASGGTNSASASGTTLDNITGFSGTGLLNRTGAGAYSFTSLTNGIGLTALAQQAANTVLGNFTGGTANVTAFSMPSCSASSNALTYTSATGFTCNTSIAASSATTASTATTQAFGDNTTSIATDAFVNLNRGQLNPAVGLNTNQTLTLSQAGNVLYITGNPILTMPTVASAVNRTYYFQSGTNIFTIVGNGGDTIISGSQTLTSIEASYGDYIVMQSNGSNWIISWQKHNQCANIMDYGGDPSSSNDNTAAFTRAAASNYPAGSVCVYFPPGVFKFNSAINYTNPAAPSSIMIKGAGQDITTLTFPNATNGISITSNSPGSSAHVRDLTITTGQNGGGSSGIVFTQTSSLNQFFGSDIYNVSLRGSDNIGSGGGTHFWSSAILINGQDNVNVESVTVYGIAGSGTGLTCQGNGTQYAIYVNISKSVFNSIGTGVQYLSYCQGMTITQSNFQNCTNGFLTPAGQSGTLSQLQISDSQFACTSNDIAALTNLGNVMIHDNDIFVHTGVSGILITGTAGGGSIHGNSINTDGSGSTNANGIVLGSGSQNFAITSNQIAGLNLCIWYESGATFNQNLGNNLVCTTNVLDQGSSNTKGVATN